MDTTVPLGYGVQIKEPVVTQSDPLDLTYRIAGNGDVSLGFSFPGGILGLPSACISAGKLGNLCAPF